MKALRVFLIDDHESLRRVLGRELEERGLEVRSFPSSTGVLEAVLADPPEAIVLDLRLPEIDGLELLRRIRAVDENQQVVVLTGHGAVPEAVEAMRSGAHDFLTKPVALDVLEHALRRAAEKRALLVDNLRLRRVLEKRSEGLAILGVSPAVVELQRAIERVARSDSSVLIQGENGTGKELVARNVHALSARAAEPFVVVNCGAVTATLVESELFGHEKGAFTGADKKRIGLFEAAHGGTLFLDEIGELPRAVQPTLLRALQFGEIRPVGSERTRKVDVRVLAATNRGLLALVEKGEFREDLYYRIATLVIDVPPLRERRGDVRILAQAFLARCSSKIGRKLEFEQEALQILEDHDWPGNVRELENAAERLSVMADDERIGPELVQRYVLRRERSREELPTLCIEELEKQAIEAALKRTAGDKKAAATLLGIAFKTLYNKLDRYGMRPQPVKARSEEEQQQP